MSTSLAQYEIPGIPAPQAKGQEVTALSILHGAVQSGASIDTIERLVALQEKMLAREAEGEFNRAMNTAQSELGPVSADLENKQTRSMYASYAALDHAVRPIYSKHGFSLSFNTAHTDKPECVKVTCKVRHASGHSELYEVEMPADGKGAKGGDVMTKTHATGAAMSYGMRYLLKYIFNIAIGEEDNDGNGKTFSGLSDKIEFINNCRNEDELQRVFKAAYKEVFDFGDVDGANRLVAVKDERKKAIREGR